MWKRSLHLLHTHAHTKLYIILSLPLQANRLLSLSPPPPSPAEFIIFYFAETPICRRRMPYLTLRSASVCVCVCQRRMPENFAAIFVFIAHSAHASTSLCNGQKTVPKSYSTARERRMFCNRFSSLLLLFCRIPILMKCMSDEFMNYVCLHESATAKVIDELLPSAVRKSIGNRARTCAKL